tara:strand:- start:659 stop:829 length:171 start_codon:yes stop_codon:yes gene_type:complete
MTTKYIILVNKQPLANILLFDKLSTAMTYGENRYKKQDWNIIKLESIFKTCCKSKL